MTQGAQALVDAGARKVYATCTHAVLSGPAIGRIQDSPIEELVVSDTIPLTEQGAACEQIKVLSVSRMLAEAIRRIHEDESVSSLFE